MSPILGHEKPDNSLLLSSVYEDGCNTTREDSFINAELMTTKELCRFATDLSLFIVSAVFVFILEFTQVFNPVINGIHCQDSSISYPLLPETIKDNLLILGSLSIPLGMIFIREFFGFYMQKEDDSDVNGELADGFYIGKWKVHYLLRIMLSFYGCFIFGYGITLISTDVVKLLSGTLRPHFLAVCHPDWTKMDCVNNSYIEKVICLTTNQKQLRKARLSFPSGHASITAYCAVFCFIYIQIRHLSSCRTTFGRPVVQTILILLAVYVSTTRVTDFYHRWTDVLAGAIIGILIGIWTTLIVLRCFRLPLMQSGITKNGTSNKKCCTAHSNYALNEQSRVSVTTASSTV